jgi:hypothetical protein
MANANKYRSGSGRDMGLGGLAGGNIIFKRKYRWTMEITPHCGLKKIPEHYVKLANRPQINIEETPINFLHGRFWLPGKGEWQAITVTYYDISSEGGEDNTALFTWLATTYNFLDYAGLHQSTKRGVDGSSNGGYGADARLTMYDGCGTGLEVWELHGMWPQSINFGELDYSSSDEATIELTCRYDSAQYTPLCGGEFKPCCLGCEKPSSGV